MNLTNITSSKNIIPCLGKRILMSQPYFFQHKEKDFALALD